MSQPETPQPEPFAFSFKEAAVLLGYQHQNSVAGLVKKGLIQAIQLDEDEQGNPVGDYRITRWEIVRFLREREIKQSARRKKLDAEIATLSNVRLPA